MLNKRRLASLVAIAGSATVVTFLLMRNAQFHITSTSSSEESSRDNRTVQFPVRNDQESADNEETGEQAASIETEDGTLSQDLLRQFTANRQQTSPMSDPRFESEPVDPEWAPQMEATIDAVIRSLGGQIQEIEELECRSTVCRAIVTHHDSVQQMDADARRELFVSLMRQFVSLTRPIIESSERLGASGVSQIMPGSPDDRIKTVFYVTSFPSTPTNYPRTTTEPTN